jgi:serine/threonine protein kinase
MKLEAGIRVQDYVLLEKLGAGAFGEVWKAAHASLPRVVAVKLAMSEGAVSALGREGVAQFGLDHPGIVKVLDANLSASPPFVVLEYVDGRSLRQLLRERGRLEIPDVAAIFRQLAAAVAFAHERGVVHGDVKPENVLVAGTGTDLAAKLTDFQLGSAAAGVRPPTGEAGLRPSLETRGPLGTYRYLAPEQELGEAVDGRADLFALGVVLFEMLTGRLPQGRDLPSDLEPSVSWWWDHIFSRCYTGVGRRYASARELLADLAAAANGPRWGDMPSQRAPLGALRPGAAGAAAAARAATDVQRYVERSRARRARSACAAPRGGFTAAAAGLTILALMIPFFVFASFGSMPSIAARAIVEPSVGPWSRTPPAFAAQRPVRAERTLAEDLAGRYLRLEAFFDSVRSEGRRAEIMRDMRAVEAEAARAGFRFWNKIHAGTRVVVVFHDGEAAPIGEYTLDGGAER